jgi:hypothetical protein
MIDFQHVNSYYKARSSETPPFIISQEEMSYTPVEENTLPQEESSLSYATSVGKLSKESILGEATVQDIKITERVQPEVQEKTSEYADENERRLTEFVIAKDLKLATANGAQAQELRNSQIASLVEESEKVSKHVF